MAKMKTAVGGDEPRRRSYDRAPEVKNKYDLNKAKVVPVKVKTEADLDKEKKKATKKAEKK
jgi:hypothetical protein